MRLSFFLSSSPTIPNQPSMSFGFMKLQKPKAPRPTFMPRTTPSATVSVASAEATPAGSFIRQP